MIVQLLALVVSTAFFAIAAYVGFVEHPARMKLGDGPLLAQWQPSYKHGAAIQAPLAVLAFALGAWAWWTSRELLFLAGALAMIANWPWTLLAILPTNNRLMAMDPAAPAPDARTLLQKWGKLHAMRTALGAGRSGRCADADRAGGAIGLRDSSTGAAYIGVVVGRADSACRAEAPVIRLICRQLSAHSRQTLAQAFISSSSIISQLSAQASHTSAQTPQTSPCSVDPRVMKSAAVWQIWMQSAISRTCACST
jgi:hypothetical protein